MYCVLYCLCVSNKQHQSLGSAAVVLKFCNVSCSCLSHEMLLSKHNYKLFSNAKLETCWANLITLTAVLFAEFDLVKHFLS